MKDLKIIIINWDESDSHTIRRYFQDLNSAVAYVAFLKKKKRYIKYLWCGKYNIRSRLDGVQLATTKLIIKWMDEVVWGKY